jgi:ribosomal protein S18 acetylase RimI-like enzyme
MGVPTARTRRAATAPVDAARGPGAAAGPEPVAGAEPGAKRRARSGAVTPVLRVRRAIAEDGLAVERLRAHLENLHARLLPDYFRPASGARRGAPEAGVTTWVGEADRVVRGYVIARLVDAPIDPAMMPGRRVQIVELCVEAPFRRMGIGTRLMDEVTEWGREAGASEAVLTVWSHNRAAFGLYGGLGFQPLARIMRRSLASDPAAARTAAGVPGARRRGTARVPSGPTES